MSSISLVFHVDQYVAAVGPQPTRLVRLILMRSLRSLRVLRVLRVLRLLLVPSH